MGMTRDLVFNHMEFINPEKIFSEIQLSEGMKAADLGCGAGFFTIALAKVVSENGKVFAVDVQKSSLSSVEIKAKAEGLGNIQYVWADLEMLGSTKISADSIDVVLLANTLFQSSRKSDIFKEGIRMLSNSGVLVVVDWRPDALGVGPKEGFRIPKEEMIRVAGENGLKQEKEFNVGDYHYGFVFKKSHNS